MHKKCKKARRKPVTEQAKAARREYKRQWARRNPDKVKAQQERYWNKRATASEKRPGEQA